MSSQLNEEQKRAVHHVDGPALVIAGAGSGKTRVVTYRISHLLSLGIPSAEILAVTFTNKAADEMRRRVERQSNQFVLTCTFHSLGARILRESIHHLGYQNNFTIYDEDDSEKVLKECCLALNVPLEKGFLKTARLAISAAKNSLETPKEDPVVAQLFEMYQNKLKLSQAVDFDDLLYLPTVLFKAHPDVLNSYQDRWSFILIDEYQDTNHAQHQLIQLLSGKHHNVFAVGDPDQSIYSWRGANVDNILNFEKEFAGAVIITLDQNYRSPSTILNAANALIQNNPSRYEKNLWSTLGPGEKIGLYVADTDHMEAEFIARKIMHHHATFPLDECVIFYRTNFQSRIFEDLLLKVKIPYVIIGGVSFYQRREIKDILSLLRIVLAGSDGIAFARTVNIPKRGLGEKAVEKIREAAGSMTLLDFCTAVVDRKVEFKLSPKQMEGLRNYVNLILGLQEMAHQNVSLQTLVSEAIERSRYEEYLKEDPETFSERRENIAELITKAAEWEQENPSGTLAAFLEELTLKTSEDAKEPLADSVKLMTLHNGKGLEFSVVFLVGMEEDLFPHVNSRESEQALEEERRLCYVGMTRAKAHLYLTSTRNRFLWGGARSMRPSRFLAEIPSEYVEELTPRPRHRLDGASEELQIGDTVHHRDFGRGIIQRAYETSLGMTYDVFFEQSSRLHSLVGKYAKLVKDSLD